MKKGPKKTISVIVPLETYDTIKKMSQADARSIPSFIRLVLRDYLEEKNSVPPQEDGRI